MISELFADLDTDLYQIAVPTPLRRYFCYLPSNNEQPDLQPGCRVLVPFGSQKLVGVILGTCSAKEQAEEGLDLSKLKPVIQAIDDEPVLSAVQLNLGKWSSQYYLHPVGEVMNHLLPSLLRKGEEAKAKMDAVWQLTEKGQKVAPRQLQKRSPRQAQLLEALLAAPGTQLSPASLRSLGFTNSPLNGLKDKGLVVKADATPETTWPDTVKSGPELNQEQHQALGEIRGKLGEFACFVLEGITGSGKTEVYLRAVAECLALGKQALILVPEIGLTPQTLSRFQNRFDHAISVLHSGLSDRERLNHWLAAKSGQSAIVIGTRSAVFTPLANPGLIIVDEEHDQSFKQQDGFRYHARDLAVKRASVEKVPVILGSATPSLESINNTELGRFQKLQLTQRAGDAAAPEILVQDLRQTNVSAGLSQELIGHMKAELGHGHQVLLFLNRRGFAPTLMCEDCGWLADCDHCDARMTLHKHPAKLLCHHCGWQQPIPDRCPNCHSPRLQALGMGTARTEEQLQQMFSNIPVVRIDRDSTQKQDAFEKLLQPVYEGKPCILIGTQMLAKGHHFPLVTLAAILDADAGLFASDFRSSERMSQLLTQVAGRAGRADKPGRVLIQTWHPTHPVFNALQLEGYGVFARQQLLPQRQMAGLPPFGAMALVRCDSKFEAKAESFLNQLLPHLQELKITGPLPAPLSRRAGMFRKYLIVESSERRLLLSKLNQLCHTIETHRLNSGLSWGLDMDPQDFG